MEAKLNVEIGAEIQKLNSGFAQAIKTVESGSARMDSEVKKVERQFTILNNTKFTFGANFQTASSKLAAEAAKTSAMLGGSLKKGANEAGFALTNLGRIAQDAPFGFIGIQNNLNPLLESFSRLKAETGSTGSALKALGGSLIGPAGLGIALSVVSAAVLFYQQYQQKANKVTKEATDQFGLYNEALSKGNKEAGKQLADLDALYKATINVSNSQATRNKAAKEVIELSNGVFKASDLEKLKNGELGEAYKSLTADIIANARAKALQEKIAGLAGQKLDAEIKLQKIANANSNESARATDVRVDIGMGQGMISDKKQQIRFSNERAEAATKETKAVISGLESQMKFLNKMQGSDRTIVNAIVGKETKAPKEKKSDVTKYLREDLLKGRVGLQDMLGRINLDLDDFVLDYNKTAEELGKTPLLPVEAFRIQGKELDSMFKDWLEKTEKFEADFTSLVNGSIVPAVSDAFLSLGQALANGDPVLEAFGKSALLAIAEFLGQLGKLIIKHGITMIAYGVAKNIIAPGSGVKEIAGGIGMVAAGSLVSVGAGLLGSVGGGSKGSSSEGSSRPRKIPGFANGVRDFSGGLAMVGERGPELVNLPTGANVIPNHNLSSFGGGDIVFNVSSRIDQLGNLITAIDRERSRLRRVGS